MLLLSGAVVSGDPQRCGGGGGGFKKQARERLEAKGKGVDGERQHPLEVDPTSGWGQAVRIG